MLLDLKCESLQGIGAARGDIVEVKHFDTDYRQKLLISHEWGVCGHVAVHAVYPIDHVIQTGSDQHPLGIVFIWDGWIMPEPGECAVDAHFVDLNMMRIPLHAPFREAKTVAKVTSDMLWAALLADTALGACMPINCQFAAESVRYARSLYDYVVLDHL
ncbi:MAG: hypothetical protein KDI50_06990 [Candidatus Competibacteraceae bacterium]|nr:hypothetical protein [Candidatus Competibacteraceae bacterium]